MLAWIICHIVYHNFVSLSKWGGVVPARWCLRCGRMEICHYDGWEKITPEDYYAKF